MNSGQSSDGQKIMILAKRRSGVSLDQLRQKQREHAELVRKIDGIRHYRANLSISETDDDELDYDLIVEIWVDDVQAFHDLLPTPEAQAAIAHSSTYLEPNRTYLYVEQIDGW